MTPKRRGKGVIKAWRLKAGYCQKLQVKAGLRRVVGHCVVRTPARLVAPKPLCTNLHECGELTLRIITIPL
ncbi:hypothetical protein GCM10009103_41320 [Pseudomonas koreensis]|nr:hypothetical protein GCM10009103_41320 [Pseudomonas koreensis]